MKIVQRWDITGREFQYGITEVDVDNGTQLYPYGTLAEAKAQFDLIKIQQRGALQNGRFRDRKFESILKRNDRI